jgi:hypothetical protein
MLDIYMFDCWLIFIILAFVTCHHLTWYATNEKPLWGEMNILKSSHTRVYFCRKWEVFWVLDSLWSVFIYFLNFDSLKHSNIFSKIIWWYLIANKNGQIGTTWNYRSKTNFSTSAAAKYSQNFQTFAQTEVAVYERNII